MEVCPPESWSQRSPSLHFFMIDDSSSSMLWKTNTTQMKDKRYPYTTLPACCHTKPDERQQSSWFTNMCVMNQITCIHAHTLTVSRADNDKEEPKPRPSWRPWVSETDGWILLVPFGETRSWMPSCTNKYRKWLEKATVKNRTEVTIIAAQEQIQSTKKIQSRGSTTPGKIQGGGSTAPGKIQGRGSTTLGKIQGGGFTTTGNIQVGGSTTPG